MIQPSISGIMVDGVNVSDEEMFAIPSKKGDGIDGHSCQHLNFRNADMVVVQIPAISDSGDEGTKGYNVYGIYGNKVVTSYANETTISSYSHLWKDKFMMARGKPYILSGERLYH